MFQFLLGVLIFASNFLGVSWASAGMGAGSGAGVMTMPIHGRARSAALAMALVLLLPATGAIAQNAYITNVNLGTVSVIDTATGTVVGPMIPVGGNPFGVAVTPDGTKAYVASQRDGTASVINTASNTVVATILLGGFIRPDIQPVGVAVTPDSTKVYVANPGDLTVMVIDTASNTVTTTITLGIADGIAVTPDGTKAYVTIVDSDVVSVISTATDTVVRPDIPVGHRPFGAAVTPDGSKVYVTNRDSGTVSVITTATNTVTATTTVGTQPQGVAVTPDGTKAYVTNSNDSTVSVIATATDTVIGPPIPVGSAPFGVAVTPDGTKVYVANQGSSPSVVSVIDTATNKVTTTIPVFSGLSGPASFGKFIGGPLHGLPPVAVKESATTTANTPVTIDLTAGASGNPTSAAQVGTPAGGTVTGFPATTVTFTPAKGFTGAANFQFTLANAFGTSNTATATITVTKGSPPIAVPEAASTSAGTPVTIDLSAGASGNPTKAAIVSGPAQGVITATSGTKVTYTLKACFIGTDRFQFTLANAYGTSNVATATITITAASTPTTAVHLVDPFLLGKVISNFDQSNIDLKPLFRVQKWPTVQANGLLADNTSAAIAVIQTNDCANDVSLTTTNGTTLDNYSQDFLTKPPTLALPGLSIPVSKFQYSAGSFFAAALVQAPIVGATYSLSSLFSANPITVTAFQGSRQSLPATMSLVIPPVILVHGIWGDSSALQNYAANLGTYDFWKLYPSGLGIIPIDYKNDIAFDDPGAQGGPATLRKTITGLWALLNHHNIVGGRVYVVAACFEADA